VSLLQNSKNPLRPFGKLSAQGERYLDYSIRGEPLAKLQKHPSTVRQALGSGCGILINPFVVSLLQNSRNTLRPFGKLSAQGERYLDYSIRGEPVEPQLIFLQEAPVCYGFPPTRE